MNNMSTYLRPQPHPHCNVFDTCGTMDAVTLHPREYPLAGAVTLGSFLLASIFWFLLASDLDVWSAEDVGGILFD